MSRQEGFSDRAVVKSYLAHFLYQLEWLSITMKYRLCLVLLIVI
jgi:hypothetical protein